MHRAKANPDDISALIGVDDQDNVPVKHKRIDEMLSEGSLDEAKVSLEKSKSIPQHFFFVVEKSDARLIYYVAGYAAQKCVLQLKCTLCIDYLWQKLLLRDFLLSRQSTVTGVGCCTPPESCTTSSLV